MTDIYRKTKNLNLIFNPKSIAIIGANKVKGTVPNDMLVSILKANFKGVVYPVSPGEPFLNSIKAYKYVVDIPDPVDLAVIVFPGSVMHMALEQCGQKGIHAAIIISAGFKEIGEIGIAREEQIKKIAKKNDISFIGPNCLGVINTDPKVNLNASFARRMPEPGNIGFLSQSGALCTAVLDYAYSRHIGFSKFISFGNKADINEIDLLYYLAEDEKTDVILLYLEEVSNGRGLIAATKEIINTTGKPILAIKSGRTSAGASAAASHTGSLAGSDVVCDAAFQQAGIIRCNDIEEMFNYALAFAYQPLPRGNRVAIITNAGGPGVLATDAAVNSNLKMAQFSEHTTSILKKSLPKTANIHNPIDVIGDARADRYHVALSETIQDNNVDGALVILTPQSMTDINTIAKEICTVSGQSKKPVYASFMGEADVSSGISILQKRGIPHYSLPEDMCRTFSQVYNFKKYLEQPKENTTPLDNIKKEKVKNIIDRILKTGKKHLSEDMASKILKNYGFPVVTGGLAASSQKAINIAEKIGYPVVMKIISNDIIHKSDMGGVIIDIKNKKQAENAFKTIIENIKNANPDAHIDGIYVRKMIKKGKEVILGLKQDSSFGHTIMFGLGGIFVNIFKDVAFRIAPITTHKEAEDLITRIKSYPILKGIRGEKTSDIKSIQDCILRLSQLAIDFPSINELDINPLIVHTQGKGCTVADVRIML